MPRIELGPDLVGAAWRTWGARGLSRRIGYEATKRSGRLRSAEARWAAAPAALQSLRPLGLGPPAPLPPPDPDRLGAASGLRLYGALDVAGPVPPPWARHPFSGHRFPTDRHWSTLSDASAEAGDIKDVWELSRLGWLQPLLRRWAATGDDQVAETIWRVVEDWQAANPPYLGPNWMCGQETSLRTIGIMFLADVLAASPATTPARRLLVAGLVQDAVGRVAPTLGYALSQRNNHASSEAGFLWTAAVLAPWLPGAERIQERARRALSEVVADQFAPDGSYAQHSPTYQRVALHVLLWCLAVARVTGEAPPPGVTAAVDRSVGHLRSLVAPGSGGRVPNLGGNDGALVFDLVPAPIGDFRPVLAHAAAETHQPSGFGPGPWDEEAGWFGLSPTAGTPAPPTDARTTHALTRGEAHAVLRAGPLRHRPAHADQLHVDVWLAGRPVAVDPGSYRYTAPAPWGNALAGEDVHNLPTRPGAPQAVRAGRFFWRRWQEASVVRVVDTGDGVAVLARLDLPDRTVVHRLVVVAEGLVLVVDHAAGGPVDVRWNLPADARIDRAGGSTDVEGAGWRARVVHDGTATTPTRTEDHPASGWHAPTYGVREPVLALIAGSGPGRSVVSAFATGPVADRLGRVTGAAARVDPRRVDDEMVRELVGAPT